MSDITAGRMASLTVLVTGGITGRDIGRTRAAAADVAAASGNPAVDPFAVDMSGGPGEKD